MDPSGGDHISNSKFKLTFSFAGNQARVKDLATGGLQQ